jgi:hypothetical protein
MKGIRSVRSAFAVLLAFGLGGIPAAAQALFPAPPVNVACLPNGEDFHVTDLDGNGFPDAIVGFTLPSLSNPMSRGIVTFLDLHAVPTAVTQTFTTPAQVIDIASGDWNEDGFVDVLLGLKLVIDLQMHFGGQGGMLQVPVTVPGGALTFSLHTGDFNGDGNLDFLSNHSWSVSVHLGDGAGNFPSVQWTAICPASTTCILPPTIQVEDVNQDGILDFVMALGGAITGTSIAPATLSIFLGAGNGTFTLFANMPLTGMTKSLLVKDFTGNAVPDIILATNSTLFLLPGLGGGSFGPAITIPVPNPGNPWSFLLNGVPAAGDLNGDGAVDFVSRGGIVMLNDGSGGFIQDQTVTVPQPGRVAIADLDRNLKPDLVFWTPDPQFNPPVGLSLVYNSLPCSATGYEYGIGCPGTGGFVPSLSARGCASQGSLLTFDLEDALGSSPSAVLLVGPGTANIDVGSGCSVLIQPGGSFVVPIPLTGLPVAGQGRGALTVLVPTGIIPPGTDVAIQAAVLDPASPFGWAASNGLALTFQ